MGIVAFYEPECDNINFYRMNSPKAEFTLLLETLEKNLLKITNNNIVIFPLEHIFPLEENDA
jgi:hypothetical protein